MNPLIICICLQLVAPAAPPETLTVGLDDSYPPFEYLDDGGNPTGFNVDLFAAVAEAMDLEYRLVARPWSEVRRGLEEGRLDALTGMFRSPERDSLADFTSPHIVLHAAVFVTEGSEVDEVEDLSSATVLVQSGDIMHDWARENLPRAELVVMENPETVLRALARGDGEGALLLQLQGLVIADRLGLDGIAATGDPLLARHYCFAVPQGDSSTLAALEEGLRIVRASGEYDRIYRRWFAKADPEIRYRSGLQRNLLYGLLGAAVLVLLALLWVWTLRRRVAARTAQLSRELAERREAEERLRRSESRYRTLTETAGELIAVHDLEGNVLFANRAMCRAVGAGREELVGRNVREFVSPDFLESMEERRRNRLDGDGSQSLYRVDLRRPDGSLLPVEFSSKPITDSDPPSVLLLGRDISSRLEEESRRREMEQKLRQVQKLESLGVLAGGIAHDFNNLLVSILGNADLALSDCDVSNPARQPLKRIVSATRSASNLTKQLLAYSGRGRFTISRVDLSSLVADMGHLLEVTVAKGVVVRYNLEEGLPPVECDQSQIQQVVMNLIINASEAIGSRSGTVTLTTGQLHCSDEYLSTVLPGRELEAGEYVFLEVSDDGAGMSEETVGRIFDPFYTTKLAGRGLGLSAVMGIVRSHSGALKVYTEEGKGTTFKVLLPAAAGEAEETFGAEVAGERPVSIRGMAVLVVDDEPAVLDVASRMLESRGALALTARGSEEALEIYARRKEDIDLVLLDMTMPHMDGAEVFRRLRAADPEVAVVLSSGYSRTDAVKGFEGKGLEGFIQKPYTIDDLVDVLAGIAARRTGNH